MAALNTNAHVSMGRLSSMISSASFSSLSLNFDQRQRSLRVGCALFMQERRESRRVVSVALVLLHSLYLPNDAIGAGIFDKYLKRKKLDPLETYIPAVILTEMQIKDLGSFLEVEQPRYGDCRSLLRAGPAASLRINIRALQYMDLRKHGCHNDWVRELERGLKVAQYASDDSNDKSAFNNVDQCLSALEELDSLLLHASRNDPGASVESMKAKINTAIDALDSLLKTVPSDVLERGRAIADAYREPEDAAEPEILDPELQQLESIL